MDFLRTKEVVFVEGLVHVDSPELVDEIERVLPTHVISFIGRTHGILDNGEKISGEWRRWGRNSFWGGAGRGEGWAETLPYFFGSDS